MTKSPATNVTISPALIQEDDIFTTADGDRIFVIELVHSDGVVCGSYCEKLAPGFFEDYHEMTIEEMQAVGMVHGFSPIGRCAAHNAMVRDNQDASNSHRTCARRFLTKNTRLPTSTKL